jgi:hypothetical protein
MLNSLFGYTQNFAMCGRGLFLDSFLYVPKPEESLVAGEIKGRMMRVDSQHASSKRAITMLRKDICTVSLFDPASLYEVKYITLVRNHLAYSFCANDPLQLHPLPF